MIILQKSIVLVSSDCHLDTFFWEWMVEPPWHYQYCSFILPHTLFIRNQMNVFFIEFFYNAVLHYFQIFFLEFNNIFWFKNVSFINRSVHLLIARWLHKPKLDCHSDFLPHVICNVSRQGFQSNLQLLPCKSIARAGRFPGILNNLDPGPSRWWFLKAMLTKPFYPKLIFSSYFSHFVFKIQKNRNVLWQNKKWNLVKLPHCLPQLNSYMYQKFQQINLHHQLVVHPLLALCTL